MQETRTLFPPEQRKPGREARTGRSRSAVPVVRLDARTQILCLVVVLIQLLLIYAVKVQAPWLMSLDAATAHAFNRLGDAFPQFMRSMYWLTTALLIKTAPFLMILVWCWFSSDTRPERDRLHSRIAAGLVGSLASIASAMAVQKLIGHRERPFFLPE